MKKQLGVSHKLSEKTKEILLGHPIFSVAKKGDFAIEGNQDLIILNFILGSWCPMCLTHVKKLNEKAVNLLQKNKAKNIVVTTESEKSLRDSLSRVKNIPEIEKLLFLSGASKNLLNEFGLRIPIFGLAKPATVVIQGLDTFMILTEGMPNTEKTICNITNYLAA